MSLTSGASERSLAVTFGSVAVLGAGTMGAQIAALVANAGVPVVLLDLDRRTAAEGLARARRLEPKPFFTAESVSLVTTGGFDTDLQAIAASDWIIEAIVEQEEAKRALLARVDELRRPDAIVSSNTSGIPIGLLAEARSDGFRRQWLGTHFFNPPRYLPLLEVIPTPDTAPDVVARVQRFADVRLGKGVVRVKDAPNFVGNRIGLYALLRAVEQLEAGGYTIEEIDAITGPILGRPKSATFRTMDVAGNDVLAHVLRNLHRRLDARERERFAQPRIATALLERGWLGQKSGRGFYAREKGPAGETVILTLDPRTMEFRPRESPRIPSIDAAKRIEDVGQRVRSLFNATDKAGEFLRATLPPTLMYTARVTPQIAWSIDDVDRVMRWGFGWELGPFELFDVLGAEAVIAACAGGPEPIEPLPELVLDVLAKPGKRFRPGPLPPAAPDLLILRSAREQSRTVRTNPGASLVDIGEGVLAVEFHSKMNALGADALEMLRHGVAEAERNAAALVVGNEATNFSAGANLMLLLMEAEEENWDEIDLMVRTFQQTTAALRYARVPVVVAPAGLTLGGACEIALHGARVHAAAETYMGLVEVGVGLVPAGGGTKEMLARAVESLGPGEDLLPPVQRVFETIGFGRTSTSAPDARNIGYLRDVDSWSMNRERLLHDARGRALELVQAGYQPPVRRTSVRVGGEGILAALKLGVHLAWRAGRITDHDARIGRALARILAGGDVPNETTVHEDYLLELERETFLGLCGEPKTRERIRHTLETGKPLRN
jgi:3-hydroxyacyl-CoA dehydrogenase